MAIYEIDALVTWVMPCIWELPDLVAFMTLLTELGDVKISGSSSHIMREFKLLKQGLCCIADPSTVLQDRI